MSIKLTQQFPREWGSLASGIEMRVSLESKRARERGKGIILIKSNKCMVGTPAIYSAGSFVDEANFIGLMRDDTGNRN